jgi:hypothetical protein
MNGSKPLVTHVSGADLVRRGVAVGVSLPLLFVVSGHFPPETFGDKHPPHEHLELTFGTSSAPLGPSATFPASGWVVSSGYSPFILK